MKMSPLEISRTAGSNLEEKYEPSPSKKDFTKC